MKPFEGIKILDFTQALSGPFCTMFLADFGAEVIKVERRGLGDQSREWGPNRNDFSSYYATFNRGKKSLSVDMNAEEGKEIIRRLVKECDMVIENFKVGVLDKLGLGYSEMKKINPEIIYGSISGFGLKGPLAKLPCYDVVAAARSGIMDVTGEAGFPPIKPGFSIGDNWTGLNCLFAAVMALYYKKTKGISIKFDLSMLDSLFYMLELPILKYAAFSKIQEKRGNHSSEYAPYGVFKAQDGYIAVAITEKTQWCKFCEILEKGEWRERKEFADNEERVENKELLIREIESVTAYIPKHTIQEMMLADNIPVMEVLNVPEVVKSEQLKAREMLLEFNQPWIGRLRVPGNPIKFSDKDTNGEIKSYGPMLGENTEDILRDLLGYTDAEISDLHLKNAI